MSNFNPKHVGSSFEDFLKEEGILGTTSESDLKTLENKWFKQQVEIGIDDANAGNLIPHEEVQAKFAKKKADLGIKPIS